MLANFRMTITSSHQNRPIRKFMSHQKMLKPLIKKTYEYSSFSRYVSKSWLLWTFSRKKLAFVDKIQSSILTVKVQAKVSQYSKKTNDFLFGKIPAQFYRRNVVLRKMVLFLQAKWSTFWLFFMLEMCEFWKLFSLRVNRFLSRKNCQFISSLWPTDDYQYFQISWPKIVVDNLVFSRSISALERQKNGIIHHQFTTVKYFAQFSKSSSKAILRSNNLSVLETLKNVKQGLVR